MTVVLDVISPHLQHGNIQPSIGNLEIVLLLYRVSYKYIFIYFNVFK
jgi:hypothetical protein